MRFFGGTQNISNRINDYIKKNKKLEVPKWNLKFENKKSLKKRHYLSYALEKQELKISLRKDKKYYQKIPKIFF